ncbi:NAD(P)/FAD-dependent oxidoreductase [Histidinibacterium lentulum]|uniref:FAD-dependent oxidoreductase n=1 Tax=Histidinibacterium lentulum TaxID=2480588 RepID=A0A3N2R9P3_9RHOB|nr:FAD-dependent oxidoreductase [Histidinibacterium lentulum]ROU04200.1 FAD-dependent oxidoreductase [Histidinibacterium lentulum]
MASPDQTDILVIGAGVIGITTALALQRAGRRVRVIDRRGVAAEASRGNAGAFAFTDIEPLATPGILRRAPLWLLDPLGPLSVPPSHAFSIAPWLWRFWRASRPRRYRAGVTAQAALMDLSRSTLERLLPEVSGERFLRREGQLQLFDSPASYRAAAPALALRRRHGIAVETLESAGAIAEIQPGLASRFTRAAYTPGWINVTDPAAWTGHLAEQLRALGGRIGTAEVHALRLSAEAVEVDTDAGSLRASCVVVAAGAWSHRLARHLGDRIPLETERGYNTTYAEPRIDLRTHLTFTDHGFAVSRIGGGVRVGGAVELGGLDRPPDMRRAKTLAAKAARLLPGFDPSGGTEWMGFRPSLPDSMPVIGRAPRAPRVIYAFGHGHLGLTQSTGTAALVAALILGQTPPIPISPYAPDRF